MEPDEDGFVHDDKELGSIFSVRVIQIARKMIKPVIHQEAHLCIILVEDGMMALFA